MLELVTLLVGMELVKRLDESSLFERVEAVDSLEAKTAIVQETEKMVFEVCDEFFKSNEEIDEEGKQVKDEYIKRVIEHNYRFFGLPTPFDLGVTFEEIKERNGIK